MDDFDYRRSVGLDTLEQFRGQANIEVLHNVLAKQLQDVADFFTELKTQRSLAGAVGKQLDGIGDIVVLSRMEAGVLTGNPIPFEVMGDDMYRRYLIFKILKNTCGCTYPDIIKAFKMFWDRPLYFREDPGEPATMIFDTGELTADVDVLPLVSVPLLRAAGVTLKLMIWIKCRSNATLRMGGGVGAIAKIGLPEGEDHFDFQASLHPGGCFSIRNALPVPEDTAQPSSTTILRTGGVFTIIAPSVAPGEIE